MDYIQEIKPKTKKSKALILSFVCFLFTAMWFGGAIGFYFIYSPISLNSTKEYIGTIKSIQPITFYSIVTNEHKAKIMITREEAVFDMVALAGLSIGDEISFRIRKGDTDKLDNVDETVELLALKVGDIDIITLEKYNKVSGKMRLTSTIGFSIAGTIFLAFAVITLLYHKGVIGKRRKI